jgi:hypothetical protein
MIRFPFFLLLCVVSACSPTKSITSKNVSPINLSEKRLFLLTYETPMTKNFIITFKNYLAKGLSEHQIAVEKYNILSSEKDKSTIEANELKNKFNPDVIMTVNVTFERGRKFYTLVKTVKQFRETTLLLEIKNAKDEKLYWSAVVNANHIFDSEQISVVRDLSKYVVDKMQEDLIIK